MKIRFGIFCSLVFLSMHTYGVELSSVNVASCDYGATARTNDQISASIKIGDVLTAQGVTQQICYAYTNMDSGDIWYELENDLKIYGVNASNSQFVGGWPVTDYSEQVQMKGEEKTYRVRRTDIGYEEIPDPTAQMINATPNYFLSPMFAQSLGCYNQSPLRYSDVNGDNQSELLVFLNNDIVVFSPQLQKTIYSFNLNNKDELTEEQVELEFPSPHEDIPQFVSQHGLSGKFRQAVPAIRAFAKVFFDDVNQDNAPDVIVWRKLYESNLKTNPTLGFSKLGDLFVHYQLVNGEYKLQSSEQADIQGWLTSKNLTWQKGFPSTSECAGQEGQLIPEMHDPLLNDPDVLQ